MVSCTVCVNSSEQAGFFAATFLIYSRAVLNVLTARELYVRYAAALAYVAVRNRDGSESIGSAFHVGEGVFVTARHVVEGKEILEIATFAFIDVRLTGEEAERSLFTIKTEDEEYKAHRVSPAILAVEAGPYYHPDDDVDVAVFRVVGIDPYTPAIPLGDHLDDWMGIDDFALTEVVILGFPPVPFARGPHLVAARGEVNALLDLRHARYVHFVVSAMPRGGFSGGVVLTTGQGGVALGVITQSLVMNSQPEQLGFMAVLSVEPIYECLATHRLLPKAQADSWDDFWNLKFIDFVEAPADELGGRLVAQIRTCDDGHKLYLEVWSAKQPDRDKAVDGAQATLGGFSFSLTTAIRDGVRITVDGREGAAEALNRASAAAAAVLDELGYLRSRLGS